MSSAAAVRDYLWFGEHFPDLAEAYCITLVRGLTPEALLTRLGTTELRHVTSVSGRTRLRHRASHSGGFARR